MDEPCQRCGEVGADRRTLMMACLYDMSELDMPFRPLIIHGSVDDSLKQNDHLFYSLRVCKDCRAKWLKAVKVWFFSAPQRNEAPEAIGPKYYVRELGTIREITQAEWLAMRKVPDDELGPDFDDD